MFIYIFVVAVFIAGLIGFRKICKQETPNALVKAFLRIVIITFGNLTIICSCIIGWNVFMSNTETGRKYYVGQKNDLLIEMGELNYTLEHEPENYDVVYARDLKRRVDKWNNECEFIHKNKNNPIVNCLIYISWKDGFVPQLETNENFDPFKPIR